MWFGMWGQEGLSPPSASVCPPRSGGIIWRRQFDCRHTLLTFYELTAAAAATHSFYGGASKRRQSCCNYSKSI